MFRHLFWWRRYSRLESAFCHLGFVLIAWIPALRLEAEAKAKQEAAAKAKPKAEEEERLRCSPDGPSPSLRARPVNVDRVLCFVPDGALDRARPA